MSISSSDVVKLRSLTGAGMMDCKNALEEAGGDLEKAADILRKKGIVKAAKRADKVAAEGLTNVKTRGNAAVIVEVNSETDFAAKSENFKKITEAIAEQLLDKKPATTEEALSQQMSAGGALKDFLVSATAATGEKIFLRRFVVVEKEDGDAFGAYVHMGGKMSTLIALSGGSEALAKDVAMHVAAANPKYISKEDVSNEDINREKEIYGEQLRGQGKPENMIGNIVKGKINKYYGEVCLLEQPYFKDEEKTMAQILSASGASIKSFIRYALGEGVERGGNDFASDVEAQLK